MGEPLPSFARFWMHNGFVNVDSEKMSKSLGNFFTIRDVVARYAPSALRLMLLGTHYRAAINYTQRALEEASDRMFYIFQTLADADAAVAADPSADAAPPTDAAPAAAKGKKAPPPGPAELAMAMAADLPTAVATALDDDLNTPQALAALSAPLKAANDLLSTKQGRKARAVVGLWCPQQESLTPQIFASRCAGAQPHRRAAPAGACHAAGAGHAGPV